MEPPISQYKTAAEATLLTFCPPGPRLRTAFIVTSFLDGRVFTSVLNHKNETATSHRVEEQYIQIPPERLPEATLKALIEEFILREGTDYGHSGPTLEEKMQRVYKQIGSNRVVILFSTLTENTTLVSVQEFRKLQKLNPSES